MLKSTFFKNGVIKLNYVNATLLGGAPMSLKVLMYLIVTTQLATFIGYDFVDSMIVKHEFIQEPIQENIPYEYMISINGKEGSVDLELLATYEIVAQVKSIKDYSDDFTSQISPRDFALAWGDVNMPSIDNYVHYRQNERWYYFTVSSKAPVSAEYVDYYSANTHIIPANPTILETVRSVQTNDRITMKGYLVNAYFKNGYWQSSLTRSDTGDGSCEIMYVTDIVIH